MLGSAKTNLPLLTLTSWVKGTSSFETSHNIIPWFPPVKWDIHERKGNEMNPFPQFEKVEWIKEWFPKFRNGKWIKKTFPKSEKGKGMKKSFPTIREPWLWHNVMFFVTLTDDKICTIIPCDFCWFYFLWFLIKVGYYKCCNLSPVSSM